MSTASAIAVQLQLTTRSTPPVAPVDLNTDQMPAIWRGEDVDFNIGIFDTFGNSVDLSNLAFLELDIFPAQLPSQASPTNLGYGPYVNVPFPTTPPAPLLHITVAAEDITPTITKEGWLDGTEQQAVLGLTWQQTLSLNLAGLTSKKFWMVVHGITAIGRKITYGGGWVLVQETGEQGIYLPNLTAPLDVPEFTILYVEPNQQLLFSETISVEGMIEIDGMLVQVS